MLKSFALASAMATMVVGAALAEQPMGHAATSTTQFMTVLPQNALLVSNIHEQNVYDPQENKIGEVKDLVLDRSGKVTAAIISVGGFLGMGEKDVAVAFDAIHATERNNKWWLTMNATKDELKSATGFRFDKNKGLWTLGSVK
ncbi:PRC-barrel domain-containing protein [Methylocystis sp. 9N]|uniref:PRC-barrel domain-containing protein n=1 Tax=Methylocystis borbori TaxID=3118750 RepID=A0ABU7XJZ6_9HYPH